MPDPSEEQIVVRGRSRTIAYAIDANGEMPAREFFEQRLKPKDCPSDQERAGLLQAFRYIAEQGHANPEMFKKEQGEIWGFKKYQARVAAFLEGNIVYLTHGFKKKDHKWHSSDFERANRIRAEHLARPRKKQN